MHIIFHMLRKLPVNLTHPLIALDMSKWANPTHSSWLTTSRVKNEWVQLGSLYGVPEILQPDSTHHGLVG